MDKSYEILGSQSRETAMKAHDVRHLRVCPGCRGLADGRQMIKTADGLWCDACAFKHLGLDGVLKLPLSEQNKFTLATLGPKAMKRLVEANLMASSGGPR